MSILDVTTPIQEDSTITKYEERVFSAYNTNALGKGEEIRIPVNNVSFVFPHDSTLYLEVKFANFSPPTSTLR